MTTTPLLEMRDVALGYGPTSVLREVNLRIDPGEIVAIVGTSGSGKSTLLRAAVGLLQPQAGTIRVFGEDLHALPQRSRRPLLSRLGLLFQDGALFGSMSVLENVMFPGTKLTKLPDAVLRELALIKLAQVGVGELADRNVHDLSGGQAKRVALARANLLDPPLLLCDEPTSGLDPLNSSVLAQLLRRSRDDGVATMLVSHDIELVMELSDRALVVAAGRVRAEGPPRVLERSTDPYVRRLFDREVALEFRDIGGLE
jgi:phospholipid/cholesterol/gamma-HCH transport system ATP-binding protein